MIASCSTFAALLPRRHLRPERYHVEQDGGIRSGHDAHSGPWSSRYGSCASGKSQAPPPFPVTPSPRRVQALELDMAVTKDNVIVVSHDQFELHLPVRSGPTRRGDPSATLSEVKKEVGLRSGSKSGFQDAAEYSRHPHAHARRSVRSRAEGQIKSTLKPRASRSRPRGPTPKGCSRWGAIKRDTEGRATLADFNASRSNVTPPPDEFVKKLVFAKVRQAPFGRSGHSSVLRFPHLARDAKDRAGDSSFARSLTVARQTMSPFARTRATPKSRRHRFRE